MELSEKAKELYDLLFTDEFDGAKLRCALETGDYSADDVNTAALWYVESCEDEVADDDRWGEFDEDYDWSNCPHSFGTAISDFKSFHMCEAVRILLDFGLDPNGIFLDHSGSADNIMDELRFVWNGYIAADTLYVLMEKGGDASINIDGERLIDKVLFDVYFWCFNDENRIRYDAQFHYYLVLIGFYGSNDEDHKLDLFNGFDVSNLKNHRNYYFGACHFEHDWYISIFEKGSNLEVARY